MLSGFQSRITWVWKEASFGTDHQVGGHPVPSHGFMFGYRADETWKDKTHGSQRDVQIFDAGIRDGLREDDIYELTGLPFQFQPEDLKTANRHMLLWYHPDKCKQRTLVERKNDKNFQYPQSEWERAQKKFIWRMNAMSVLEDPWLRKFWSFHIRRCLGLVAWFLDRIPIFVQAWC